MSVAEILQILIGIISIVASVFLSLIIFFYQIKTDKRVKRQDIENKMTNFIIENKDEIKLLPLCIISNCLHKTDKHARKIYTNFNKLSKEVQFAVLEHEEMKIPLINNSELVDEAIAQLEDLCKRYKFGRSMLYDGAKYLHRSYEYYKNENIEDVDPFVFDYPVPTFLPETKMSLLHYMIDYLDYNINPNSDLIKKVKKDYFSPPMDVLYAGFNLGTCDEKIVSFWIMRFIISSCYAFANLNLVEAISDDIMPDIEDYIIQTYEDMYYYCIYMLLKTFSNKDNFNTSGKNNK